MKDYYKILGVDKNASKEEIKKAFRKLAHQHHPDKGGGDDATKKFKEASEAYSVLSDDNKRKQYDMFGSAGVGAGGAGGAHGGFNPGDFAGFDFSGFQNANGQGFEFDLGDIFGDLFGRSGSARHTRQQKGHDISIDLVITLEQSVFGFEKDIQLTKASKCVTCKGTGAAPGSAVDTCSKCGGRGKMNEMKRSFIGVFNTTRICDQCNGAGQIPRTKCSTCRGTGVKERQEEITIKVPAGIEDGQMLRLSGMGEAIPFGTSGDLYVKIHVKPHNRIRREGNNLVMDTRLKLTEALTGGEVHIDTLDGSIALTIPEGSNNGDILRLKGKGVPSESGRRGDLLVRIVVDMPKKLSKAARQAIDDLKREGL